MLAVGARWPSSPPVCWWIVLLFLTKPLQYMPHAVLSSVVLLIGIELIDLKGLHRIAQVRTDEFVVAVLTAATVVLLGVEQGIVLAIVASILIHVRRSYHPVISVLEQRSDQTWKGSPLAPTLRTMEGVAVVRFASSLYYANANALLAAATELLTSTPPLRVLCLDLSAVSDIDYTGAQVLRQVQQSCAEHQVTLQFAEPLSLVHGELERYGLLDLIGTENLFDSVEGAVIAARSAAPAPPASEAPPNPS